MGDKLVIIVADAETCESLFTRIPPRPPLRLKEGWDEPTETGDDTGRTGDPDDADAPAAKGGKKKKKKDPNAPKRPTNAHILVNLTTSSRSNNDERQTHTTLFHPLPPHAPARTSRRRT